MTMTAAAMRAPRGLDLLLVHCRALGRIERGRSDALDRLEAALGEQLAHRLVDGLTPGAVVLKGHVGALREGTLVKFTQAPGAPAVRNPT